MGPFITALEVILQPESLVLIALASVLGLVLGTLPGMGSLVALALVVPLTFGMDPMVAFMLLAAVQGGVNFGGSVTAILLSIPGSSVNAATILDGYPMTEQGRAGEALGASAVSSAAGAIIGVVIIVSLVPLMEPIIIAFGPPEIFWLAIWGLTMVAIVTRGSAVLPGLVSAGLGLLFSFHGYDPVTGTPRFSYDITYLFEGIGLIPSLVGLFAIGEMLNLLSQGGTIDKSGDASTLSDVGSGKWRGAKAVWTHRLLFLRSAVIGTLVGIIPGVGGTTANYVAYFQASQSVSDPESFGTGDIRGVIASEASNDAKDGGAFLPTLGLGIPGSAAMAVLLSAFIIHGIQPGPLLLQQHMDIFAAIVITLIISNVVTSVVGLSVTDMLAKITQIPSGVLAPVVMVLAFMGVFTSANNVLALFMALGFGILGYIMVKAEMSRVPMILGIVLGPIAERNFNRSLQISDSEYGIFLESPLSLVLILLVFSSLLIPYVRPIVKEHILKRNHE